MARAARASDRATARTGRNSDARLVALYLDMLAAERGAGNNTLAAYGRDLEDFSQFLKDAGHSIARASTADLRAYLGDLSRRGLRVTTVARRLSAIRQLYRFLYAEGQRADDPAAVLEGPKRESALPKTLTLAEVDALLHAAGIAAAYGTARLPARDALRDGLTRLRTRGLAGIGGAQRRARDRGARQGQKRAARAA
jgi:integrase/recombinase XerD